MSPRTIVAKQFENLALRGANPVSKFSLGKAEKGTGALGTNGPPQMRRFVGLDEVEAETQSEDGGGKRQRQQTYAAGFPIAGINPSRWDVSGLKETAMHDENPSNEEAVSNQPPPRVIKSPPPAMFPTSSAPTSIPHSMSTSKPSLDSQTLTTSGSDFFDLTSLTWQDSEITGHLMLDSDDDGYGINGIGFKPTAAMANARSLRRKQQVLAWRSREAKEERERRAERRKRYAEHLDMVTSGGQEVKKAVRFSV
jgi:hypothetical protein